MNNAASKSKMGTHGYTELTRLEFASHSGQKGGGVRSEVARGGEKEDRRS